MYANTPDIVPSQPAKTFPTMNASFQSTYDPLTKTTSVRLEWRKSGVNAQGFAELSPFGPYTLEIADFDAFAKNRAKEGDLRWAQIGMDLMPLLIEIAKEDEMKRIGGGDGE